MENNQSKRNKKACTLLMIMMMAALVTTACSNAQEDAFKYQIDGKTNFLPDKTEIMLFRGAYYGEPPSEEMFITSMKVKDGSFSYDGESNITEAGVFYIPAESAYMPVFIEKGTIKVFFDKNPINTKVFGTPLNDSIQSLAQKDIACAKKTQKKIQKIQEQSAADGQEKIQSLSKSFRQEVGNNHFACALRNIDNELGFFLTLNSSSLFSHKQLMTLIHKLPKDKHSHPKIKEMDSPVNRVLPDFSLQDERGYSYNVKSLVKQNKVTIIDFWASWCGPCMNEMPNLVALYRKYMHKGLGIVGISIDKDKNKWVNAYKSNNAEWIQLWDENGDISDMFNVTAIPHTIIVNQNGEILATKLRGQQLEELVQNTLKQSKTL